MNGNRHAVDRSAVVRGRLLLLLLLVTPAGFASKFYTGPAMDWVNNYLGGVLYVLFWCLLLALLFPGLAVKRIAAGVLLVTCIIEVSQLWHPPLLESIRGTFPGRVLIGTQFSWLDFPHYIVGAAAGWWLLDRVRGH